MSKAADDSVRIVLADDHRLVRTGLRMLLDAEADFEVVAEAGDVASAIRCLRGYRPDVLLLDLNMPGGSSVSAIPQIAREFPSTAIVVLTMDSQPPVARETLRRGARGYVLKESADGELVEAVRLAARGATYLTPSLGARLALEPAQAEGEGDELTDRETEILRLIALGHTNADIAGQLFLSVRTVESHRAHIQRKLHRRSRAELVRYALDHGLMAPSAPSAPGA